MEVEFSHKLHINFQNIIEIREQDSELCKNSLEHLRENIQDRFLFPELDEENLRDKLWSALLQIGQSHEKNDILVIIFNCIRILSREKKLLDNLVTSEWLDLLGKHIGLNNSSYEYDDDTLNKVIEAEKALCNIIFNSLPVAKRASESILTGIIDRVKHYSTTSVPDDVKYFDMKLLFLFTALLPNTRTEYRKELIPHLVNALELILIESTNNSELPAANLTDKSVDIACETLKTLFNVTLRIDDDDEEAINFCNQIVQVLKKYLLGSAKSMEKTWQLRNDIVNLLTNMPNQCYSILLIPIDETTTHQVPNSLKFEDYNMIVIYEILMFLKAKFNDETPVSKQNEIYSPVVTVLLKGATGNRVIRKYLRHHILPPLKDIHNRPEVGTSIRNHLCKLLTSPMTQLKGVVAELLFTLCKKNVKRMIKYTGYGNAAGLFAQRGLLGGQKDEKGEAEFSSDTEDSETEEYAEHKHGINPVLGCYEQPKPSPMANMSEEQKEYEAMKLVQLIDDLTKSGCIKPCTVGKDGKPKVVEHVLQLQEGLNASQVNKQDSDSN